MSPALFGKHIKVVRQDNLPDFAPPPYRPVFTPDGQVGGLLCEPPSVGLKAPLVVCVHGIGSNGRYFDLQNNSMAAAAMERGARVLLIDRPGYGVSAGPKPGSAIDNGVKAVHDLVNAVRASNPVLAECALVLIGHSFGGAIAMTYAVGQLAGSIAALCVSGIGDRPDKQYLAELQMQRADGPARLSPHWFFGPGNTYDWRGVTALRTATEPQHADEVHEVAYLWPARWAETAAMLTCPVHFRLAEFERIWEATPAAVERIAAAIGRASRVDAALALGGGHLYEAHHRGAELVTAQLDFALNGAGKTP